MTRARAASPSLIMALNIRNSSPAASASRGYTRLCCPGIQDEATLRQHAPRGLVLSGGPHSVYEEGAPSLPAGILTSGLPVLGICYGLQLLAAALGGEVARANEREYGRAQIERRGRSALFAELPDELAVWMSHGDRLARPPAGFRTFAQTANSPYAAIGDEERSLYGLQFHPEVAHTPQGNAILRNFIFAICGCRGGWSPAGFIADALSAIQVRVGGERVLLGLSGGVDSAVTAALLQRAVGDQLTAIFVDNGLLRRGGKGRGMCGVRWPGESTAGSGGRARQISGRAAGNHRSGTEEACGGT